MTDQNKLIYLENFKFNKILQILTYSDSLLWGGYYMMNAIVAIYLYDSILINPLETITIGYSIYLLSRSVFQIPIAQFLDAHKKYTDEAIAIFLSCIIMALSIYSFQFITKPWHLYLLQLVFGLGTAINMPAWRKTFARFIDKGYEGTEYSIYDVINNIVIALLVSFGGFLVTLVGSFEILFDTAAIIMSLGGFIALLLLKQHRIFR